MTQDLVKVAGFAIGPGCLRPCWQHEHRLHHRRNRSLHPRLRRRRTKASFIVKGSSRSYNRLGVPEQYTLPMMDMVIEAYGTCGQTVAVVVHIFLKMDITAEAFMDVRKS